MGAKENLIVARDAIAYVRSIVTLGAGNRGKATEQLKDCQRGNRGDDDQWCVDRYLQTGGRCPDLSDAKLQEDRRQHLKIVAEQSRCGNCAEQASVAYFWLRDVKRVRPLDFFRVDRPVEHEFVLIGRRRDGDPLKVETWGNEAVVCDPWDGGQVYLAKDIRRNMRGGKLRRGGPTPIRLFGVE